MSLKRVILIIGWAPFIYLIYRYIDLKIDRIRLERNIFNEDKGIDYFKEHLGEDLKPYKVKKNNSKESELKMVAFNLGLGVYSLRGETRVVLEPNSVELVYMVNLLKTYSLSTVSIWIRILFMFSLEYILGLYGIALYGIIRVITSDSFLNYLLSKKDSVNLRDFNEILKSGEHEGLDYMTRLKYVNAINEKRSVNVLGFKFRL